MPGFGHIDFGTATYLNSLRGEATNDSVLSDANVTAKIEGPNSLFVVENITSYNVSWQMVPPPDGQKGPPKKEKVYTEVASTNGVTPLHVLKGQAVIAEVALVVPSHGIVPGPISSTLTIQGDSWGPPNNVPLNATLMCVDESTPIGVKWIALGGLAASGAVHADAQMMPDGSGSYQEFDNGTIVYSPDFGACWLSKAIYSKLNSASLAQGKTADGQLIRDYFGYPTGDTFSTYEPGGTAALFEHGMIVIRANGAAWAVYGLIYVHYSSLGSIAEDTPNPPVAGLPTSDEQVVPNGRCSHFEVSDIYWQSQSGAWEIHGAILDRWNDLGGASGTFGFPTSDELPVTSGTIEIGRYSRFAGGGRIYWSAATGAFEVNGAIRDKYLANGGPAGALGFPVSGETDTPGGGRFNQFQNGFVVWHADGPYNGAYPVGNSVQLQLFSYQDTQNDDFNVQINITDSNGQVNHGRMPPGDNYHKGNYQFNPPALLMSAPISAGYTMDVWMLCIHENTFGSDDEDGTVTAHYSIDNLWGTADSPAHSNASFKVNMKPMPQPQIFSTDPDAFRKNLYWPFRNFKTPEFTWTEFSETFTDVGEGDLDFNVLPWNWHLFERFFFEAFYRYLANSGNCFGMALESIYAREFLTMFIEPIYDNPGNTYSKDPLGIVYSSITPNNAVVVEQVNIKHGYQLGAQFLGWFLSMEMQDQLQDPVFAFKSSRQAFASANWPMIMISRNELQWGGHVVVPYEWLVSFDGAPPVTITDNVINSPPFLNQQWIIRVANPYCTPETYTNDYLGCEIYVDPSLNTFSLLINDGGQTWRGQKGSGGRMMCAPFFGLLNVEPQTPGNLVYDLVGLLIFVGFSGDGQTQQISDELGRTYYSYGLAGLAGGVARGPAGAPKAEGAAVGKAGTAPVAGGLDPIPTPLLRSINRDPKTRIPYLMLVPTFSGAPVAGGVVSAPAEMYCIRRPNTGFKWASGESKIAAPLRPGLVVDPQWLGQLVAPPSLTFEFSSDGGSQYHWNLIAPRMSIDISPVTAVKATDSVTVSDPGSASQKVTLITDKNAPARVFSFAVGGWRGNWRKETKVFSLSNVGLDPGGSFSAGVSDGGQELWLHNPGKSSQFDLEIYVGAQTTPALRRPSVTLDSGKIFRIAPSSWNPEAISNATLGMAVFDPSDGKLLRTEIL